MPGTIGALSNLGNDMPMQQEQKVSMGGEFIAEFSGSDFDSIKIFRLGNGGYYGDTGDFDFTANDMPDLLQKLRRIGATSLDYGELK
jgi:hypothetical protein